MKAIQFQKATKRKTKLRMSISGPPGSGKTFTALTIARALGAKIAVIDSENGSASKYSGDIVEFDVLNLESFDPDMYIEAIRAAGAAGYDVIVVDSLSHAWTALLDFVDQRAKASKSGNTYMAWRDATPKQNALVQAIIQSPCHVIATMRSKVEYALDENDRGKKAPRKIGMAPVQREGVEYEFDVVGELTIDHDLIVSKSRCSALADRVISKPGEEVAKTLLAWLDQGEDAPPPRPTLVVPANGAAKGPHPGAMAIIEKIAKAGHIEAFVGVMEDHDAELVEMRGTAPKWHAVVCAFADRQIAEIEGKAFTPKPEQAAALEYLDRLRGAPTREHTND